LNADPPPYTISVLHNIELISSAISIQITDLNEIMTKTINSLLSAWQGNRSNNFRHECEQLETELSSSIDLLRTISVLAKKIADDCSNTFNTI
jgi:uncharacterized protein YukE